MTLNEKKQDEVRKVLVMENQINQLVEKGYLVREQYAKDGRTAYYYMLGANSLNLLIV
jgi:predicted transcriptional regulator